MSVTVTFVWRCDVCGAVQGVTDATDAWHDPSAIPPTGWTADYPVPLEKRSHPTNDICDACPDCDRRRLAAERVE